jgi:hypothetical protein
MLKSRARVWRRDAISIGLSFCTLRATVHAIAEEVFSAAILGSGVSWWVAADPPTVPPKPKPESGKQFE